MARCLTSATAPVGGVAESPVNKEDSPVDMRWNRTRMFEYLSPHGTVAAALIAPPGPDAIAALAPLAHTALSASARVDLLVALERQASWLTAVMQPVLAKVADAVEAATRPLLDAKDPSDMPLRAAHAEIGAALRIADSTAASQLETARRLTHELPMVHAVLAAGRDHLQAGRCDRGRHV